MEEDQGKLRFICKLCDKKYPCGKSLGGHMRSHMIAKFEPTKKKGSPLLNGGTSNGGYGLRENPKKTWRAVDFPSPLPQDNVCKQCGKGFQSLKALCGHMACHSERERVLMDSYSDPEVEDPRRESRSENKRYTHKKIVVKSCFSLGNSNNGCSSVSEIDEQEQEEVARCLMMLSRDSGNWVGVNSGVEYSDNNSVVFETKSSSIDMELKKVGGRKFKTRVLDVESDHRNGTKKIESDISVEEYLRNGEYKNPRIRGFDTELGRSKYDSRKRTRDGYPTLESGDESSKKAMQLRGSSSSDVEVCKNANKRSKFECSNCNKTFNSHQALGGHRPCNKKVNACFDYTPKAEKRIRPKKGKGLECPICHKIFKSEQALGGHKRSHFTRSNDKINQTPVVKKEVPETRDLIDLNLPAPIEDEEDELAQFI